MSPELGRLLRDTIRLVAPPGRRLLIVSAVAVAATTVGGGVSGAAAKAGAARAGSPCDLAGLVAWAPGGKRIAWVGRRWLKPASGNRDGFVQAICTAQASGSHVRPLAFTGCSTHCGTGLFGDPRQLSWTGNGRMVYLDNGQIFSIKPGHKPKLFAGLTDVGFAFSTDATGNRIAYAAPYCPEQCAGPVTVLNVATGAVVGKLGGDTLQNVDPSLSPNGKQVVFERDKAQQGLGIWIADSSGGHLRQLTPSGSSPYWSPVGDKVAYVDSAGLHLVSAGGGTSKLLVPSSVQMLSDGWSPNGKWIAFDTTTPSPNLDVVSLATGHVRNLVSKADTFTWSPDSRQLLLIWRRPSGGKCPTALWRVRVTGTKPRLVHSC